MPNIFEFFIEDSDLSPPVKLAEEGQATNFLLTAGDVLGIVITNLCFLFLVVVLALCKPTSGMRNKVSLLLWVAPMRIAVEGYLDFNIAIALQSRNLNDNNIYNLFGIGFGVVIIMAYIVLVAVIYSKVYT